MIPRMIYTTKLLYGDPGELIVGEILIHGMTEMESIIQAVNKRLREILPKVEPGATRKVFNDLMAARFIITEPIISREDGNKEETEQNAEATVGSKRKIDDSGDDRFNIAKRPKVSDTYSVNFGRYSQYFRDQLIISGIKEKFGVICGEIMRAILRISEVTTSASAECTQPISSNEVRQALPMHLNIPLLHVEQHLSIMIGDQCNLIEKLEESSSNLYVVNLKKCIEALCQANVLSYILERYGSKCCRMFKLLMLKNHLEQKQVEDFAMILSKEAKELLYHMWSEHMLVMQEVPKTIDHAPSRTYYLYNVNLNKVIRTLLGRSYQTLLNILARQRHEVKCNKRLTEKQARVELIKESVEEGEDAQAQLQEIDEMLTPAEHDQLQKFEHCQNKLGKAQIQVANTAFLFNLYLSS